MFITWSIYFLIGHCYPCSLFLFLPHPSLAIPLPFPVSLLFFPMHVLPWSKSQFPPCLASHRLLPLPFPQMGSHTIVNVDSEGSLLGFTWHDKVINRGVYPSESFFQAGCRYRCTGYIQVTIGKYLCSHRVRNLFCLKLRFKQSRYIMSAS